MSLGRAPDELVALQRSGESGVCVLAEHLAHAAQSNFAARARSLRKSDDVFDRLTHGNRLGRGKQHSRRTHVLGLTFGLRLGSGTDDLERKSQLEALILSLFDHNLTL